jgi:acetyltransferase-like isoleucine patch superfamily enzyme
MSKATEKKEPYPQNWIAKEKLVFALTNLFPVRKIDTLRMILYRSIFGEIGTVFPLDTQFSFQNRPCYARNIRIGSGIKFCDLIRIRVLYPNSSIQIHDNVSLDRGVELKSFGGGAITIGEGTYLGQYSILSGSKLTIGKYCLVASHVGIYSNNHNFRDAKTMIKKQSSVCRGITVGDDCWLGTGVKVVDGVTIDSGAVIGAGAVVTKDIPGYAIAAGVPAKVIGKRE